MNIKFWILANLLGSCLITAVAAESRGTESLGASRFLFLDNAMLATIDGARLVVNPPRNVKLVMIAEKPWEAGGIISYGNVLWDPKVRQYRMYYVPICWDVPPGFCIAMATSVDGVHWEKPNLGAVLWKGSRKNNIVVPGQREGTVLIDPNAPLERRYAVISSEITRKTQLFTSPDGIHFTTEPELISPLHSDALISSFWDGDAQKYFHYPRIFVDRLRATGFVTTDRMDEPWPEVDTIPIVLSRDQRDPPELDLYTNSAQKYASTPNVYLAFPSPYYHYNNPPERAHLNEPTLAIGGKKNDGTIESQLATSRDGRNWTRYRTPYLPLENYDGCELKVIHIYPGMFEREDKVIQYFAGYTFTHGDTQVRYGNGGREMGGVFRAEQRIDGFISMDFDYEGGEVVTEPFTFEGNRLVLNLNTSASGEARVAVLDAAGNPIEGYALGDARYINGNYPGKTVAWKQGPDVGRLANQEVRLRFVCRGTKLYSFRFETN